MKRAVLVDSTANIGQNLYDHPDVFQVNLNVNFNDGSHYSDTWDDQALSSFYEKMAAAKELPTTSQPSPQNFAECFEAIIAAGYDSVIVVLIASKISGTFQTGQMMAGEYEDQLEIHVVDSGTSSYGLKNMVEHILKWYDQGQSNEKILSQLKQLIADTVIYGAVHDLTNFIKGGRISHIGGRLAGAMKVGSVFSVDQGQIDSLKMARSKRRIRQTLDKLFAEKLAEKSQAYRIAVVHTNIPETAQAKAEELRQVFTKAKDIIVDNLTIVIGTQVGEDVLAYVYLPLMD
ncbi:DegV family protein [Aerococcus kribbianus]|uniref:DegV family protein n=1 Tax=Aerococcus kribbianus TaxID=2999064 RepID=A0A9X3FMW7_9LACT|nr:MULTISPECIES: DegV family protein [unclassified Aerococcus]MCZ0717355.1 DegV family protein [Aerococcus sp. YH-aer221]MCZ0725643.1 DegV family protein [Aerococcus sp. YH-aer222]